MAGRHTPSVPDAILKDRQLLLSALVTTSLEDILASHGRPSTKA